MAHIRQLIRDQVISALTGLNTTGSNVFGVRVYPMNEASLPGIIVYTEAESTEYVTTSLPRTQLRSLTVRAEVYVRASVDYEDILDTITAEIEAAIYSDVTLGGYAKDSKITSFETGFSGDAEQPVITGLLAIEVDYTSTEGTPTG